MEKGRVVKKSENFREKRVKGEKREKNARCRTKRELWRKARKYEKRECCGAERVFYRKVR